ncbi:MAG: aspartate-semialdehyde dehydrogenase [Anaerolineae bacterium]|nr:aspartate-semialdehyde dehydrogenase [Anaerolineae bacterium]
MTDRIPAAILGATGMVGQRFIQLLEHHPLFRIGAVLASARSAGKTYAEATNWVLDTPMPASVHAMVLLEPDALPPCEWVFSALPGSLAGPVETRLAADGHLVCSNASAHRMDPLVPLIIPEVNGDHLEILPRQRQVKGWEGTLITAPNCTTTVLALALKPLHDAFRIESMHAVSMQGLSGAGYPGVPALDIIDNILPYIKGEEEKLVDETRKLLGTVGANGIAAAAFAASAQCNRVPVREGHFICANIRFARKPSVDEVIAALERFEAPAVAGLPSAPPRPVLVTRDPARPQPRLDRAAGGGMSVTVGRVQRSGTADIRLVALGHNTLRGAAGGALLNGEWLLKVLKA